MTGFIKIVRPFSTECNGRIVNVFIKITFDNKGRLSLTGVEGPRSNGDCAGSCGQIDMHDWSPNKYAEGWDADKVAKLRQIWHDWHMNDMRAYSPRMAAEGWREKARVEMLGYKFTMTDETYTAKKNAELEALDALRDGRTFEPTPAQTQAATLPHSVAIWEYADKPAPAAPEFYKRAMHTYGHCKGELESPDRKTLGWLKPSEHPEGLLGRKVNPDDEHGYGSKWWFEAVPADVLEWLNDLPDADTTPAWV